MHPVFSRSHLATYDNFRFERMHGMLRVQKGDARLSGARANYVSINIKGLNAMKPCCPQTAVRGIIQVFSSGKHPELDGGEDTHN